MLVLCAVLALILYVVEGKFLIYSGPGTSPELIMHLEHSLAQTSRKEIARVLAKDLANEDWFDTCDLLIIPGGRDLEYVQHLSVKTLNGIRKYVEGGGKFLGICGGAYFASSRVEFEVGTPFEVVGERNLSFYQGTAYGSAFPPFTYDRKDARAAAIVMHEYGAPGRVAKLFHAGGCYFKSDQVSSDEWNVIGSFANGLGASIIGKDVGKGKIVLSCSHIEFDPFHPSVPLTYKDQSWYLEIKDKSVRRKKVFDYIISKILKAN